MYIGVCGLSGSGKTTLSNSLINKYQDFIYIDIDEIGHKVIEKEEVINKLVISFSNDILENNKINRKKLGEIVFNNPIKMKLLEDITWKYMEEEIDNLIKDYKNVIFDWQLLPKVKYFNQCDIKVLLNVNKKIRRDRILKRDNISDTYFELRDKASIKYQEKDFDVIIDDDNYDELNKLIHEKNQDIILKKY